MARTLRRHPDEPVRITTAAASPTEDIAARQRRYVISMGIRTACFVAAIVADGWLRWVLIVAALLLPYVAVVMANNSSSKSDGFMLRDGDYTRPELTAGPESGPRPEPHGG
jgi:amino acid transporter